MEAAAGIELTHAASPGPRRERALVPAVDVRTVLFKIGDAALQVALPPDEQMASLPRRTPHRGESLDATSRRAVRETVGAGDHYLEQLYTLSIDQPSGWSVIVSYLGLGAVSLMPHHENDPLWYDISARPPLSAADDRVIEYALMRLRAKIGYTTIAFHLLPPTFTLSELQRAYETILDRPLDKRNFRRRLIASSILASSGAKRRDGSHRPALLYRFRAAHDPETYLTPSWAAEA